MRFIFLLISIVVFLLTIGCVQAMNISFFEEFPDEKMLERLDLLESPTKIYLATHNLTEFTWWATKLQNNTHVQSVVYWPILQEKEGYWISPWIDPKALQQIFNELEERDTNKYLEVMLDLELPKSRLLLWKNRKNAAESYQVIKQFRQRASGSNLNVRTIESASFPIAIREKIGLRYPLFQEQRIIMYYSSFRRQFLPESIANFLFTAHSKDAGSKHQALGIGLIAPGIYGNEPIYSSETLLRELKIAEQEGVSEVIIFRLGGLDDEYVKVLAKLTD